MSSNSPANRPTNRFARHRKKTLLAVVGLSLACLEMASWTVLTVTGRGGPRADYPYNRMISGYTVFKNTPGFRAGTSTIRTNDSQAEVVFDAHGFIAPHEISESKPPETVRIFILGGSTAVSGGQNTWYHNAHPYPDGFYTYELSIAGQLQSILSRTLPGIRFEVITAAGYQKVFHQSVVQYLEQISRFEPDYLVCIEGHNDTSSIVTGTPYADVERDMLQAHIDLWQKPRWPNRCSTYLLISKAIDKWRVSQGAGTRVEVSPEVGNTSDREQRYRELKPAFIKNSRRFRQIVEHLLAVVETDGVKVCFVLQPMLYRATTNKPLNPIEERLRQVPVDGDGWFVTEYFFDDWLSEALRETVESHGGIYLDANQRLVSVPKETSVFTDYCHLTVDGNRLLAEWIGAELSKDVRKRTSP